MGPQVDFTRLAQFKYAIINVLGNDGYPYSVPTEFQIDKSQRILLKPPVSPISIAGKRAGVLFNHITAVPTGGYTDRRYMLIWGSLVDSDGMFELRPEALSEWDEKILSFPELCAKAAPQGQRYLEGLQSQVEA
jgi:1,4-dihydroxy-2-naphthoate octaprenyltransferase